MINVHVAQYRNYFFRIINFTVQFCGQNQQANIMFNLFWKSWILWVNVEKYARTEHGKDDNILLRMHVC
jgi:hypothetical protein